jgi:hypothetical protein
VTHCRQPARCGNTRSGCAPLRVRVRACMWHRAALRGCVACAPCVHPCRSRRRRRITPHCRS